MLIGKKQLKITQNQNRNIGNEEKDEGLGYNS